MLGRVESWRPRRDGALLWKVGNMQRGVALSEDVLVLPRGEGMLSSLGQELHGVWPHCLPLVRTLVQDFVWA